MRSPQIDYSGVDQSFGKRCSGAFVVNLDFYFHDQSGLLSARPLYSDVNYSLVRNINLIKRGIERAIFRLRSRRLFLFEENSHSRQKGLTFQKSIIFRGFFFPFFHFKAGVYLIIMHTWMKGPYKVLYFQCIWKLVCPIWYFKFLLNRISKCSFRFYKNGLSQNMLLPWRKSRIIIRVLCCIDLQSGLFLITLLLDTRS